MPLGSTVPSQFLSEVFRLFDGSDVTKKVKFILSGVTSGNVRALTIPDSNGVIVLEGSAPEFTGVTLTGLTPTSVLFVAAGGLVAEDGEFVYDSENNYLKIQHVSVGGDGRISAYDTVNDDHDFIINAKGAGGVFINKDGGGSNGIYFYNGADYKLGWFGGTTFGEFRAYSEGNTEWFQFASTARYGFLEVKGAAPRATILNNSAYADVWMFQASGEGKTRALRIYGRRTGDSKRYLSIVTGGSAADTVDFTGLGSYKFNGIVEATELKVINAINEFSVDGTLVGNSDSVVPTEKAVRTYVDNQVAGVNEFVELTDTPNSYDSADIGKVLRLKNDLSGLEFTDSPVFAGLTVGSLAGILKGTNGVVSAIIDNSGNWNTAYGWGDHAGLYDPAGTMTTHEGNFTHSDIALNTTHRGLSSGNPHSVTPTELSLVIGTNVQAYGAALDDLSALGAPASDGQLIVATGDGVFAYEKDNVARTSLGLGTSNSPTFTGITLNQGTINNAPSVPLSIATKGYVDSLGGGGSTFWTSIAVATTENIDLSQDLENGDTIDGWALVTGDRVLVKDQTDATENGLYTAVASGAASRSSDADTAEEIVSRKCIILHGDTYEDTLFFCATSPITLGVTNIEFNSLAGGGIYGVVELLGDEYEIGGTWIFPGSVADYTSEWIDDGDSIDEDTDTFARHYPGSGVWYAPLEFTVSEIECSKFRVLAKCDRDTYGRIRGHYYDGSWHILTDFALYESPAWFTFPFGGIKTITKVKIDARWPVGYYEGIDVHEVECWDISSTAQHKITLEADTPTSDIILTFPNITGSANQALVTDGSGVLSWKGHDDLADFVSGEHFLQTAITNVSTGLSTGLLKVTTGSGALSVISDGSSNWNDAYTHSGLASGNPHSVTPTELSLVIGTNVQAADAGLLSLAGLSYAAAAFVKMTGTDTFVLRTIGETADDLEATIDHNNLDNGGAHDYSYISGNDGNTNVTGLELEELTDGSQTILHSHAGAGATFLDLIDTPNSYDSADIGKYLRLKDDLSGLEFVEGAGGITTFPELTDTPADYTGSAGKYAKVNVGEDGLEFDTPAGGGVVSPIGSIVAWHKTFANTPALPSGWVECNGQTLSDAGSVYDGQVIPNLNGDARFLRGNSVSGTEQAATNIPNTYTYAGKFYFPNDNGVTVSDYDSKIDDDNSRFTPAGTQTTSIKTKTARVRVINMSVVWIMRVK